MNAKKRFFLNHRKSSALVVSVAIHLAFVVVALTYVAVTVYVKPETTFEVKDVKRPNMKLRKLQVPVKEKKSQAPKLRKNIVTKPKIQTLNIQMPEVVGVVGGMGAGTGSGLGGMGFGFEMPDLFGGNSGSGNELVGHFYDLKQTKNGGLSEIGELVAKANGNSMDPNFLEARNKYREAVANFLDGWKAHQLDAYFKAQREKFATSFMIPEINASEAPKAFGVESEVKPMQWVALYQGRISAPETGKYRFVGIGDDILVVRVKKKVVIDACWTKITNWTSRDPNSRKYPIYRGQCLEIGDWMQLEKGVPVPVEVLIGEEPGGGCFFQLYIQKEGEQYPVRQVPYVDSQTKETINLDQPVLPIFKTAEIDDKVVGQMQINPNWATAKGPSFGVQSTVK